MVQEARVHLRAVGGGRGRRQQYAAAGWPTRCARWRCPAHHHAAAACAHTWPADRCWGGKGIQGPPPCAFRGKALLRLRGQRRHGWRRVAGAHGHHRRPAVPLHAGAIAAADGLWAVCLEGLADLCHVLQVQGEAGLRVSCRAATLLCRLTRGQWHNQTVEPIQQAAGGRKMGLAAPHPAAP